MSVSAGISLGKKGAQDKEMLLGGVELGGDFG